jgi:tetratricopeptide (TPR) repeat protein
MTNLEKLEWKNTPMSIPVLERPKAASASFLNKLLEIEPSTDDTWYIQGNDLFKLGRLEEAIASYDKALEFRPNDNAVL